MSDEPPLLRLKPRSPSADGGSAGSGAPPPPPPPQAPGAAAPAPEGGEGTGRLRLKPRLNLPDDGAMAAAAASMSAPPPPAAPASPPVPEEPAAEAPEEDAPKFKLRPKAPGSPSPAPPKPAGADALPPPPPPPTSGSRGPIAPEPLPEPPPPERTASAMPPMSILAAPLPPPPPISGTGVPPPAPPPPAPVPRLSLSATPPPPTDRPPEVKAGGALGRFASKLPKIGGKPGGKAPPPKPTGTRSPMGKPGKVLRRRSALSPWVKAGILVAVLCLCVGAYFSYRFLGPDESSNVRLKIPKPGDHRGATDGPPKVVSLPTPVPSPKADDDSDDDKPVPTPTPTLVPSGPHQIVMGDTNVDSDVRVGSTPLDAAPSASAAFRSFVANAVIGGVFQGRPARALINGTIAREGQVVNSSLGIAFERIDSPRKMIYFKDYTGAEVSKSY